MYTHAPKDYICPICLAINGIENEHTMARQADIVYRDEYVIAYINSKFIPTNPGHVIVVTNEHFENLYTIPAPYLHHIAEVSQKIAVALKSVRNCDGVMIKQNNEPASGQHAFHYHMHIIPRFDNDDPNGNAYVAEPADRIPFANQMRDYLDQRMTNLV